MNCMPLTYYVTLMAKLAHVCLIASFVKIITIKRIAVVYRFKSPGWFHVETYMHVLGLSYANTAGAIKRVRRL